MRIIKKVAVVIGVILLVLSIAPYFIRVSKPQFEDLGNPYEESRFEVIDSVKIHYRLWIPNGDIKGRVMLIHGLGGSTFSWNQSAKPLVDEGYLVLAVDLPGFGYSDRQKGMDHSQNNRAGLLWDLARTIDSMIDDRQDMSDNRWFLTGHSMGGGTAAAMVLLEPDKTKAIVLVAGALLDSRNSAVGFLIGYPPAARWIRIFIEKYAIAPNRIKSFLLSAYGREPTEDEINGYLAPLSIPATSNTMIDLIRTAENEDPDDLKQLELPVLGIWGAHDTWVPLSQAYMIKEYLPHMQLHIIEQAAHCPMETHPGEFNEILIDYLNNTR